MKIEIRKSAIKDLKHISEPFKTKIHNKILELKDFPNIPNIKKLTNFEPAYIAFLSFAKFTAEAIVLVKKIKFINTNKN